MAETMGQTASSTRNTNAAIGIFVLALAPQLFELVWSFGTILGLGAGRGPAQVLLAHGAALLSAAPNAVFGSVAADAKKGFSSDVLLVLIYSYPLFAVAIVTLFVKIRAPQDYIGGIVLMALALLALWASSDLQGMRGFSFGLARPVVRLRRDRVLCTGDPAARPRGVGVCELHDRSTRHA
jgi:hypothetical protein